ncbi:ABC transporter permease [bacterium]|nr:ABC transporter permease [bacterium]
MRRSIAALQVLTYRDLLRFVRQRSRLIGALITPLLFWLLIGGGLGSAFRDPTGQVGGGYLHYFFPGMLALSVLFTAIFSTITVIEDRNEGFLQGVLVSPVSRITFLWSKVLAGAILGAMQAVLLLLAAPFIGITLSFLSVVQIVLVLLITAMGLTALGFFLAWKINSVSGYHSMMNLLLMPLWLLSGAVFPIEGRGSVFSVLAAINPLSYAMKSLRALIFEGYDPAFLLNTGLLLAFLVVIVLPTNKLLKS